MRAGSRLDAGRRAAQSFPREILGRRTDFAARRLIGSQLVRGNGPDARVGRIVEVEAYVGEDDLASHARFGRTKRNAVMFGRPGVAYVYLVYGMHNCLNVVTEPDGHPAALLIRAVEPVSGDRSMRSARLARALEFASPRGAAAAAAARKGIAGLPVTRLASGPGLLCAAFSIDRADDGLDLCDPASALRLELGQEDSVADVATGPRVGIDYAPEPWRSLPWRFFAPGSPSLSTGAKKPLPSRAGTAELEP